MDNPKKDISGIIDNEGRTGNVGGSVSNYISISNIKELLKKHKINDTKSILGGGGGSGGGGGGGGNGGGGGGGGNIISTNKVSIKDIKKLCKTKSTIVSSTIRK